MEEEELNKKISMTTGIKSITTVPLDIPNLDALNLLKDRTFVYQVPRHMIRKALGIDKIIREEEKKI